MKRFHELYQIVENEAIFGELRNKFAELRSQIDAAFKLIHAAVDKPAAQADPEVKAAVADLQSALSTAKSIPVPDAPPSAPESKPEIPKFAPIDIGMTPQAGVGSQQTFGWTGQPTPKAPVRPPVASQKPRSWLSNMVARREWHTVVDGIESLINEVETGSSLSSVIAASQEKIMKGIEDLETAVLHRFGTVSNAGSSASGPDYDKIMSQLGDIHKGVGDVRGKLDTPPMPLTADQEDKAYTSIDILNSVGLHGREHPLKLIHVMSGQEIPLDRLRSAGGKSKILALAGRDRRFQLVHAGGEVEFSLGDVENVTNAVNDYYEKNNIKPDDWITKAARFKTKAFGTRHGNENRPISITGTKKRPQKGDAERQRVQTDMEKEELERKRQEDIRKSWKDRTGQDIPETLPECVDWKQLMRKLSGLGG